MDKKEEKHQEKNVWEKLYKIPNKNEKQQIKLKKFFSK